MNTILYTIGISAVINLCIGYLVYRHKPQSLVHQSFGSFTLGVFFWSFGFILLSLGHTFLFSNTLTLIGAMLSTGSLLVFSVYYLSHKKVEEPLYLRVGIILLCLLILITPSNLIISHADVQYLLVTPHRGPLFLLFAGMLFSYLIVALINIVRSYLKALKPDKNAASVFMLSLTIFLCVALLCSLILPLANIVHLNVLGFSSSIIFVGGSAYTLLSQHILDVRIIVQRIFVYFMLLGLVIMVYLGLIFVLQNYAGSGTQYSLLLSALITLLVGAHAIPYIDKLLRSFTDAWFFAGTYHYQTSLLKLGKSLEYVDSLADLNELIINELSSLFRTKKVRVAMAGEGVSSISASVQYGFNRKSLWIPLFSQNKFIASIHVSAKKSGEDYSQRDYDVAETWGYQLSLKIRHILLLDQLKLRSNILEDELKESEEKREHVVKNQDEMIVDIAHNLQTPLAILKGELSELNEAQKQLSPDDINELTSSVDRISTFIDRLIYVGSHTEHHYHFEKINLSRHIQEIGEYLHIVSSAKEVNLVLEIDDDISMTVDKRAIEELLVNLVSNSIKYRDTSRKAKIVVSLSDTHPVMLKVSDNGLGIDAKKLPLIFDRWYKVDTKSKGSGIGLSIVRKIAQKHAAHVRCSSEYGVGTTITVVFPEN